MKTAWVRVMTVLALLLLAASALVWWRQETQPLPALVSPDGLSAPSSSRVGTSALSHGGAPPDPVRPPPQGATRSDRSGGSAPSSPSRQETATGS
ncbi:MAG TPA: hypothetical protein VLA99_01845 [Nitrospiraceae bacterium]|nr:hypothetical protein [Nitrospiraceae bacterium]